MFTKYIFERLWLLCFFLFLHDFFSIVVFLYQLSSWKGWFFYLLFLFVAPNSFIMESKIDLFGLFNAPLSLYDFSFCVRFTLVPYLFECWNCKAFCSMAGLVIVPLFNFIYIYIYIDQVGKKKKTWSFVGWGLLSSFYSRISCV